MSKKNIWQNKGDARSLLSKRSSATPPSLCYLIRDESCRGTTASYSGEGLICSGVSFKQQCKAVTVKLRKILDMNQIIIPGFTIVCARLSVCIFS